MVLSGSKTIIWTLALERHKKFNLKPMAEAIHNFIGSYPGLDIKLLVHSPSKLVIGNSKYKATHWHWWNDCVNATFY